MHLEEIQYKSSKLKIITDKKELIPSIYEELVKQRSIIEKYIVQNILFESSLEPIEVEVDSAQIVKEMAYAGKIANVGPMAAVAGTIAEILSRKLIRDGAKVAVVENGGDIFAITDRKIKIGIFSGQNKFSGKFAFELGPENTPLSICSSSSYLGHSLSFGKCDLATVFSKNGNIADACVTALCNRITNVDDIESALQWVIKREGVQGALIIKNDKIGVIGELPPMIKSTDNKIKEKITKEDFYNI